MVVLVAWMFVAMWGGGGGVDSGDVWGGVDSGGCACCERSSTSILRAVPRRVAARICLHLLVNLSLRGSSSMSVSLEDTARNILSSSLK